VKQHQEKLKGQVDKVTIIVTDFNITLLTTDRIVRQNVSKDTEHDNTINQQALADIYRTLYPAAVEYTLFSSAHRTQTRQTIS
jgi:hypothetical protein